MVGAEIRFALLVLSTVACWVDRAPAAESAARDPRAMRIIENAVAVPATIGHVRVAMQHAETGYFGLGQLPLSANEEMFYSTFTRSSQPDGSTLLVDRNEGEFENLSPGLSWTHLWRIGGDGHSYLAFSDHASSYIFMTRHPEVITRRSAGEQGKGDALPLLQALAENLREESRRAESVRWRGRELTHEALCEVIDLSLRKDENDPQLRWGDMQEAYYIGVTDGLIHRKVETQGPPDRRYYSEVLYVIDRSFVPKDISYVRFEAEVRRLLKGRPLPPIQEEGDSK